jgi:hypothetical protein
MPAIHAAAGLPSSVQGISFSPLAFGVVRAFHESHGTQSFVRMIAEHSHAPPVSSSPAALPLRI